MSIWPGLARSGDGIVGAALLAIWAKILIAETRKGLRDRGLDHPVSEEILEAVETGPSGDPRITDLHVWRVGKRAYSRAVSVVTRNPTFIPAQVRKRLAVNFEIADATIEIQVCSKIEHACRIDGAKENSGEARIDD